MADIPNEVVPEVLGECPYRFYARVREENPVSLEPEARAYVFWRYEDISQILKRPDLFRQAVHAGVREETAKDDHETHPLSYNGMHHLGATDKPEHTEMRNFLSIPFKPARVRAYTPMIRELADGLIDRFIDRGTVEFVSEFAYPFPAAVICRILGLPTAGERFEFIKRWSTVFIKPEEYGETDVQEMHRYVRDEIVARHAAPRDDVISELTRAQQDRDGELDLTYLTVLIAELVAGGVLTTGQVIAHALQLLLDDPAQMEAVRSDYSLIPRMFEEALRLEPPVQYRYRIATADVELKGVNIPAGSYVWLAYGSANRDSRRFPDADEFKIDRPHRDLKNQLGFGYGLHFCLGAPLARREGEIAFERIFDRMRGIRLARAATVAHLESPAFRGLKQLDLEFERA